MMKKRIMLFLLCFASLSVMGQGTITRNSTRKTEAKKQTTEQPAKQNSGNKPVSNNQRQNSKPVSQPTGYVNGHGYVDLGLSVKWATCNVGASSPEEFGDYFAWGETETKASFLDYKWSAGSSNKFTKYVLDEEYGKVDYIKELLADDDVAYVKWGGDWRMPTCEEFHELVDNAKWVVEERNGILGYLVVSNINKNSVFLPFGGVCSYSVPQNVGKEGNYWSKSVTNYYGACYLSLRFDKVQTMGWFRSYGLLVRPITTK